MKSKLRLRAVFALFSVQLGGLMISVGPRKILALMIALALAAVTPFPTSARAITTTNRVIVPYEPIMFGCNGEPVFMSGELLLILHTTIDDRGGVHQEITLRARRLRGVGSETGTQYRAAEGSHAHFYMDADGAPWTFTSAAILNLVSQGGSDNFKLKITFHITVNANGEVTVQENTFTECVG